MPDLDDDTRARRDADRLRAQRILVACAENWKRYPWITVEAQDYLDLLTELDQAAPVLTAAEAWEARERISPCEQCRTALREAVAAWRAAREG